MFYVWPHSVWLVGLLKSAKLINISQTGSVGQTEPHTISSVNPTLPLNRKRVTSLPVTHGQTGNRVSSLAQWKSVQETAQTQEISLALFSRYCSVLVCAEPLLYLHAASRGRWSPMLMYLLLLHIFFYLFVMENKRHHAIEVRQEEQVINVWNSPRR